MLVRSCLFGNVVPAEDDLDRALCAHHRDFCRRPCVVDVAAEVLRRHDVVRAAVRLARDNRHLGYGRFGVRKEKLRAMSDDATVLLRPPWKEARHVDEGKDWDVEAVAETHKTRRLNRGVDVEAARELLWLVGHDTDGAPFHASEASKNVRGKSGGHLEQVAIVENAAHEVAHIVRHVGVLWDHGLQRLVRTVARVLGVARRRRFTVARWQEAHETAHLHERLQVIQRREVRHARSARVRARAAEHLGRHLLVRNRLDNLRPCHEHVRRVLHHHREVSHRRRVDGPARAGAHDH
mmetsp:Transcript_21305/g.46439  ORF Transcript_21305/g.46439 Transcript_21305/m.46439 type:complete len:294 (-) Transcript_21305:880-1761(-)